MNIALFGGTFDPVHCGHLAAARAAQAALQLDAVHFVPARVPPHKRGRQLTAFAHRYAMVALGCVGTAGFVPSLIESGEDRPAEPNYSITTVRKMAAGLGASDLLFFLIGADAFLDIRQWREPVALLDAAEFIVVSRPGFSIARVAEVIPPELEARALSDHAIALRRTRLHLLTTVEANISSSGIRRLAAENKSLRGLVPDPVAEYIRKLSLYEHEEQTE